MHDLPIELLGAPILRKKASAVKAFDSRLRDFLQAMFRTMYRSQGQGLAAPQVGMSKRIVVVDLPYEDSPAYTLINPRIVERGAATARLAEGCLSIPGVSGLVQRSTEIVVEARDLEGARARIEATGDLAHCMQHEIDHLDGILYIDHLSQPKRQLVLRRYERLMRKKKPHA